MPGRSVAAPPLVVSTNGACRWTLAGDLSLNSVGGVWARREEMFRALAPDTVVSVDLGGVSRTDSAGLALLIALLRDAHGRGVRLRFDTIPGQMRSLARVSGVSVLLGLEADPTPPPLADQRDLNPVSPTGVSQ